MPNSNAAPSKSPSMPDQHRQDGPVVAGIELASVVARLGAAAPAADATAAFPREGIEAVHQAGLLELTVAERYSTLR